jgi:hypothetical protein
VNNIFVLNKNYKKIGTLSNQGAKPQAPYYNDLYTQELDTGADTYQFSTVSNAYTQDCIEIGNHIMFAYKNRNELFTITSIEYSHSEGYKTTGVYAEGIGFELLEIYMKKPDDTSSDDEGGRDEDNDGDTSTDDEYADLDDMYLHENGIIIYDKDGSGPPKEEDMYVDENGIIVYKRSKNNRKNDSLEFKNISYPTFLNVLLKNTDWSFVCQPGLESIKHDITVQYDRNIYAILQDSMQSYKGVELEFVFEYNNGKVQKTIKAYKDGGRGSFVGKRFEYGTNIKGITKTQKVANNEDDTVLYVDDVGIEVYYDVDFALKSAEVPEIEIGDTHYVIDTDFHPPMNIKARIGKIEVSFTDPTKNKIYLANNKKISGSAIDDELNADDVLDMLDDYDGSDDYGDSNHAHDRLIAKDNKIIFNGESFYCDPTSLIFQGYDLGKPGNTWRYAYTKSISSVLGNINELTSWTTMSNKFFVPFDRNNMAQVRLVSDNGSYTNIQKRDLYNFIANEINVYECSNKRPEQGPGIYDNFGNVIGGWDQTRYLNVLSEEFFNYNNAEHTICTTKKVATAIAKAISSREVDEDGQPTGNMGPHVDHIYNLPSLLCAVIGAFQYHVANHDSTPNVPSDPGDDSGGNFYNTLHCQYLKTTHNATVGGDMWVNGELHIGNLDTGSIKCFDLETSDMGNIKTNIVNTYKVFTNYIENVESITFKDSSASMKIGTSSVGSLRVLNIDLAHGRLDGVKEIRFSDNSVLTSARGISGGGSNPDSGGSNPGTGDSGDSTVFDTITVRKIQGPDPGEGQYNRVEFEDGIMVSHIWGSVEGGGAIDFGADTHVSMHNTLGIFGGGIDIDGGNIDVMDGIVRADEFKTWSDKSLKENIRYIDAAATTYSNKDLLEKADLYDFIVNQVNLCEYNYIGNSDDRIGLIANEYEGTKVGDKIVSRDKEKDLLTYDSNNLLFATIGALQEEVRIRDEKIATLEDRLARIEAMLGINNNDN